jgi:hypothetical protein
MQDKESPIEETEENEPLTKKKPRSEKQIEAFKNAMKKRADNIELKKQEKLVKASEILVKNAKMPAVPPIETPKPKFKKIIQHESETESEEEIIIVKAKPKKKKVKKIIIESSESESDSGSDGGSQTPAQQSYVQREYMRPTFNSFDYFI